MVVRRFFGEIILSSMKTRPKRLESFFCDWYFSGIKSCCCRSRQTSVFSRLGSIVVSVISSCRSVEKFFSVSLTACSKSQFLFFFPGLSLVHVPSWHTVRLLHRRSVPNSSPVPPRLRGLGPFRSRLLLLLLESVYSVPVIVKMGTCLVVRVGTVVLAWADLEPRKDQRPLLCPSCLWLEASALLWADTLS